MERHNGRQGKVRLLNGRVRPELVEVAAGQVERWRLVNVSSARYVNFSLGGLPFRIIGSDGGLIEAPVTATEVSLAPADRVEIVVGPFEEGREIEIQSLRTAGFRSRKPHAYGIAPGRRARSPRSPHIPASCARSRRSPRPMRRPRAK